nr:hypothetical protein [Tanacetum cinerariifolium]
RHPVLAAVRRGAGAAHARPGPAAAAEPAQRQLLRRRAVAHHLVGRGTGRGRDPARQQQPPGRHQCDHQRRTRGDPDRPGGLAPADH